MHVITFKTAGELVLSEALHHVPAVEYEMLLKRRLPGLLMLLMGYLREQDKTTPLEVLLAAVARPARPSAGRLEIKPVEDMPEWARKIHAVMRRDCDRYLGKAT